MEKAWTEFNINCCVKVRLTDLGRKIHREAHDDLVRQYPKAGAYRPPEEDADGWSKWQMWCLMQEFGPHISLGMHQPIEAGILIEQSEPCLA